MKQDKYNAKLAEREAAREAKELSACTRREWYRHGVLLHKITGSQCKSTISQNEQIGVVSKICSGNSLCLWFSFSVFHAAVCSGHGMRIQLFSSKHSMKNSSMHFPRRRGAPLDF